MTKIVDGPRTAERSLAWNKLEEVSVVGDGDNPSADVLLLKSKTDAESASKQGYLVRLGEWCGRTVEKMGEAMGMMPRTVDQILVADEFQSEFAKLRYAFSESCYSIMQTADPAQMADLMQATSDQFAVRVKELLANLNAGSTEYSPKALDLDGLMDRMRAEAEALKESGGGIEKRGPLAVVLRELEDFDAGSMHHVTKATWDAEYINNLPDVAFAYVAPGGKKDENGLTVPRSLRSLPHHNATVKSASDDASVDMPHLRNAMSRLPQTNIPAAAKEMARKHMQGHMDRIKASAGKSAGEKPKMDENQAEIAMKSLIDRVTKMEASTAEALKRAEGAEARANASDAEIAKLRSRETDSTFTEKARALGLGETAKVSQVLKNAYAVSPEAGAALEEVLTGLSAKQASHDRILMQVKGLGAGHIDQESVDETTPMGKLQTMAKKYVSDNPDVSVEEAVNLIANKNPRLKKAAMRQDDDKLRRNN